MENYKTCFNKNFKLSLNGKFVGLDRVYNLQLFEHKLKKVMSSHSRYGSRRKCFGATFVGRAFSCFEHELNELWN